MGDEGVQGKPDEIGLGRIHVRRGARTQVEGLGVGWHTLAPARGRCVLAALGEA